MWTQKSDQIESPSLEILKSWQEIVLGNWWLWAGGLEQDDLQSPLEP